MRRIEFSPPDITDHEIQAVSDALRSGWITTGQRVKAFERALADYMGTPRAACLSSATAAMELTLRILGIGPGDEVITSAYTYSASAAVIHHVGAKIVFADTAPGSFLIDPNAIVPLVTARTKAVIAVDIGGRMCDYKSIEAALSQKRDLYTPANALQAQFGRPVIIADAAHAFGAKDSGIMAGHAADFTCFSFHAIKNLTTAEGGAVTWRAGFDDDALYKQYMLYSLHGQDKDALAKTGLGNWEYDILFPGYKCNMTEVLGALGHAQLDRFPDLLNRRRELVKMYEEGLSGTGLSWLRHADGGAESSAHLFMIRIPGYQEAERAAFIKKLAGKGISANVHFRPLPLLTAYKNLGHSIEDVPNAFLQYQNEVSLPLHTKLEDDDVHYICRAVREALS